MIKKLKRKRAIQKEIKRTKKAMKIYQRDRANRESFTIPDSIWETFEKRYAKSLIEPEYLTRQPAKYQKKAEQ